MSNRKNINSMIKEMKKKNNQGEKTRGECVKKKVKKTEENSKYK